MVDLMCVVNNTHCKYACFPALVAYNTNILMSYEHRGRISNSRCWASDVDVDFVLLLEKGNIQYSNSLQLASRTHSCQVSHSQHKPPILYVDARHHSNPKSTVSWTEQKQSRVPVMGETCHPISKAVLTGKKVSLTVLVVNRKKAI